MIPKSLDERYQVDDPAEAAGPVALVAAREAASGKPVVIWTVSGSGGLAPEVPARFLRIAQTVQGIQIERIPRVLEAGDEGGVAYAVVERVEGLGLDQAMKGRGRLSVAECLGLTYQALHALAAAHAAGVAHGSIEPRALVLQEDGLLKLVGLESAGLAGESAANPTPYEAPEIAAGIPADPRSDFFSLAAVLYELLSGRHPYPESDTEKEGDPAPLRMLRPDAPKELETLLARALDRDPDKRPQSAEDMEQALEAAMQGKPYELAGPIEAAPPKGEGPDDDGAAAAGSATASGEIPVEKASGKRSGARLALQLVAAVLGVAVVGLAIFLAMNPSALDAIRGNSPAPTPVAAPTAAPAPATEAPTAAPTARPTAVPPTATRVPPTPTTAPTATARPAGTVIPAPVLSTIGAKIQGLRLFESGPDGLAIQSRVYATQFSHTTARFLNYELNVTYPDPKRQVDFVLRAFYYDANGTQVATQMQNAHIEAGWTQSYHWNGYGWPDAGHWQAGKYRVDLYDGTEKIATLYFEMT